MDRLEKIKGYTDRAPKDDVKWLIREVEAQRQRAVSAGCEVVRLTALVENQARALEALRDPNPPRCPCGFPDDHAGWCPRREV